MSYCTHKQSNNCSNTGKVCRKTYFYCNAIHTYRRDIECAKRNEDTACLLIVTVSQSNACHEIQSHVEREKRNKKEWKRKRARMKRKSNSLNGNKYVSK